MSTWMILVVVIAVFVIGFGIYLSRIEGPGDDRVIKYFREVQPNPVMGEAKILKIKRAFSRTSSVVYEMIVEITTERGSVYELNQLVPGDKLDAGRWEIPIAYNPYIKQGATIPVVIHPNEPEYIYFEFEVNELDSAWKEKMGEKKWEKKI